VRDDLDEFACIDMEDGRLVFEPREALTEKERADLNVGRCPACQDDIEFDYLMNRIVENNSRCIGGYF
jgi:hypothetical protein